MTTAKKATKAKTANAKKEIETRAFASATDMERWLEKNHDKSPGIWLKIAKKDSGAKTLSYAEALDVALAFGWIDGQKAALDERHWLQRFTPRRPGSRWSTINRDKAEALIAAKKMRGAGLAQIDAAKADGRWADAYEGPRKSTVPPDLARALARHAKARAFFDALDSANRYAILYRLQTTKNPELRAAKLEKFVTMLLEGRKIHER